MILSEKILEQRKRNGWSQEDLAQKVHVSRQAVSKWEVGTAIPDLDKILLLSEVFSVSTDYLLKDSLETSVQPEASAACYSDLVNSIKTVSLEEASAYMDTVQKTSWKTAAGTALCILSPICLIQLAELSDTTGKISEGAASGIGLCILLLLIAAGAALLITNGMKLSAYDYLDKEEFSLAAGVKKNVEKKRAEYEKTYRTMITAGVVICIMGVIPLLLSSSLNNELLSVTCVNVLLAAVACAVVLFTRAGGIYGSYDKLLQIGDYTVEKKKMASLIAPFPGIYWCTAAAIYLAWSFFTGDWGRTWILWPVAGVGFVAVMGIVRMIVKRGIARQDIN